MARPQDDRQQRRTLLTVLGLNAGLAAALGIGGVTADSSALLANAVDNASDAAVYLISFLAIGRAGTWKRGAARASGVMLLLFAAGVLVDGVRRVITGTEPIGPTMMALALAAARLGLTPLIVELEGKSGLASMFGAGDLDYAEAVLGYIRAVGIKARLNYLKYAALREQGRNRTQQQRLHLLEGEDQLVSVEQPVHVVAVEAEE